ncbi:MAG: hypothetical protein GXO15_03220 [Crenarchaeota archaeon]|nr:hypothetical protein [Thermoproteota archaeon]
MSDAWLLIYMLLSLSSAALAVAVAAIVKAMRGAGEAGERVVEELRCPSCGYSMRRRFVEGDYVGHVVDFRCPRCGVSMVVSRIYVESAEPLRVKLFTRRRERREKHLNP